MATHGPWAAESLHAIVRSRVVLAVLAAVSVIAVVMTFEYQWAMELSAFTVGLAKATLGIALVKVIDNYIFHGFETRKEIKDGNVAAALYLVGLLAFVALILYST